MRLSELADQMQDVMVSGQGDPGILSITSDSRDVRSGALFAAIAGNRDDGAKYINDAVENGAAAVMSQTLPSPPPPVPVMVCEDVRKALGQAADAFYDHPSALLDLIGVTGTNGKTTTAYLVRHIMNQAGRKCGMLGTIEYDLGDKLEPAPLTTPDSVRFTRSLAEMRDFGCSAAVVEVSSHALSQSRSYPHRFACAIFTNLSRDHLDYHGDMESYLQAKRTLFLGLDEKATAVANFRDPAASQMTAGSKARVYGYWLYDDDAAANLPPGCYHVSLAEGNLDGQRFIIHGYEGADREFCTPLVGRHNVENCLGAALAALSLGVGYATVRDALENFPGVPGRLERLDAPNGAKIFVDYAHTDDALRSVLSVLRPLVKGKLITVFGCGGDRDKGKRPMMAKAAEEQSDAVVVTSDNPRTEQPEAIIADIMPGFADAKKATVVPDRAAAIRYAVGLAGEGDAVLVAGKGHENYQIIGTEKIHLDDRELVREAFHSK